jgi:hypothetical protein
VLDQRAFNQGTGDLVQTNITGVALNGATQHVTIDAALIGNPSSFGWRAVTRDRIAPAPLLDRAPDAGFALFVGR